MSDDVELKLEGIAKTYAQELNTHHTDVLRRLHEVIVNSHDDQTTHGGANSVSIIQGCFISITIYDSITFR